MQLCEGDIIGEEGGASYGHREGTRVCHRHMHVGVVTCGLLHNDKGQGFINDQR